MAYLTNQVGVAVRGQFDWQALNDLKATGMRLGLRVNFGRYSKATVDGFCYEFFRAFRVFRGQRVTSSFKTDCSKKNGDHVKFSPRSKAFRSVFWGLKFLRAR